MLNSLENERKETRKKLLIVAYILCMRFKLQVQDCLGINHELNKVLEELTMSLFTNTRYP